MIQIDMEMPKSCKECSLPHIIANGNYCYSSCSTGRPDWCPLVDLGKHGRLIDADELAETAEFYETEMDIKNHAKTVIEAEDG